MRFSKLHGLGNDFLVLLDDGTTGPLTAERAAALCHRRSGVGADGLIRSERIEGGAVSFELLNADGGPAEMSGNGARALGLAAARAGWWEDRSQPLVLHTKVGARLLEWLGGGLEEARLAAAMGVVRPLDDAGPLWEVLDGSVTGGSWYGWAVDVGNPHAVALIDGKLPSPAELDDALAPLDALRPDAFNHEFVVRGPEAQALTLVVRERGAGWTQACGTGSVAAAWAAHEQGWVGSLVTVHNPGGSVQVDLSGPEARLAGPVTHIADVEVAR